MYRSVLQDDPRDSDALHLLGVIEGQKRNYDAAFELVGRSLQVNPRQPLALANLARLWLELEQPSRALESADRALQLDASGAEAHYYRGVALRAVGRPTEAMASLDRAIERVPDHPDAQLHRGDLLLEAGHAEAALDAYDRTLRQKPQDPTARYARGRALLALHRITEALAEFDAVLRLRPDYAPAHTARGVVLHRYRFLEEALASYDRALELGPDAVTHANRAAALIDLGRTAAAVASLEKVMSLAPEQAYVPGSLVHAKLQCCDWRGLPDLAEAVRAAVAAGKRACLPFEFLVLSDSPAEQLACARIYVADRLAGPAPAPAARARRARPRISIGYLSADFHDHATAHLIAGLLERHDRAGFEVTAFSCGARNTSAMRERIRRACDAFLDVQEHSDRDLAALIRQRDVDILIELNGFAGHGRPQVLGHRPAPVQVNYLGYPGTLGGGFADYVIADREVIPRELRPHYSESVVYLPYCYQPNDRDRPIAPRVPARAAAGLPERGFVFCCFNANYKINAAMFDVWMRLLNSVEDSVLWLYRGGDAAADNLKREARERGVDPGRLVFAERLPQAEHLARHALADLFLDTAPVNAHTTASDALWAGLPVLTCRGNAFAGRVAASLLVGVGLPELAVDTLENYERLALQLATTPAALAELRQRLSARASRPLFDTDRYRRDLESAYRRMWESWLRGESPADFSIEPS